MNAPVEFISSYRSRAPLALLFAREETQERQWSRGGEGRHDPDPKQVMHWDDVHARLVRFGIDRARHEREVCRWLLAAERLGVHLRAGYASLREYADRTLGLKGRQTEERLRVGRALRELPQLDAALSAGELCWSAVRELTRVATAETEDDWVGWSTGRGIREVERAVADRRPGERPDDRPDPSLVKHRLSFEVRAETMALFRDAQARLRQEVGGELDDDALLLEMARRALGGPGDDGRAGYQVAVVRCDACKQASIDAGGAHHRAVHQGRLCIDGSASTGFHFRHADGTPYGGPLRPASLDVAQQVFGALTTMGFKPTQARALVDAVTRAGPPLDASEVLRTALRCT